MEELWRKIEGNSDYEVSNFGRVYSNISNKVLKPWKNGNTSYLAVSLRGKKYLIHRLVATAFIPNDKELLQVHHIDNNKVNNRVTNLMWVTASENLDEMRSRVGDTSAIAREALAKVSRKPVHKLTLDGEIIDTFKSAKEAAKSVNSSNPGKIGSVANGRANSYKGFKWAWADKEQATRSIPHNHTDNDNC